ncbi:hypothetical protein V8E53_012959 [Lactarius tabidus]
MASMTITLGPWPSQTRVDVWILWEDFGEGTNPCSWSAFEPRVLLVYATKAQSLRVTYVRLHRGYVAALARVRVDDLQRGPVPSSAPPEHLLTFPLSHSKALASHSYYIRARQLESTKLTRDRREACMTLRHYVVLCCHIFRVSLQLRGLALSAWRFGASTVRCNQQCVPLPCHSFLDDGCSDVLEYPPIQYCLYSEPLWMRRRDPEGTRCHYILLA